MKRNLTISFFLAACAVVPAFAGDVANLFVPDKDCDIEKASIDQGKIMKCFQEVYQPGGQSSDAAPTVYEQNTAALEGKKRAYCFCARWMGFDAIAKYHQGEMPGKVTKKGTEKLSRLSDVYGKLLEDFRCPSGLNVPEKEQADGFLTTIGGRYMNVVGKYVGQKADDSTHDGADATRELTQPLEKSKCEAAKEEGRSMKCYFYKKAGVDTSKIGSCS